jgi:hypothetical protein
VQQKTGGRQGAATGGFDARRAAEFRSDEAGFSDRAPDGAAEGNGRWAA